MGLHGFDINSHPLSSMWVLEALPQQTSKKINGKTLVFNPKNKNNILDLVKAAFNRSAERIAVAC